jgi:hypothetical protein
MEIAMRVAYGPNVREIAVPNRIAFFLELLDNGGLQGGAQRRQESLAQ